MGHLAAARQPGCGHLAGLVWHAADAGPHVCSSGACWMVAVRGDICLSGTSAGTVEAPNLSRAGGSSPSLWSAW